MYIYIYMVARYTFVFGGPTIVVTGFSLGDAGSSSAPEAQIAKGQAVLDKIAAAMKKKGAGTATRRGRRRVCRSRFVCPFGVLKQPGCVEQDQLYSLGLNLRTSDTWDCWCKLTQSCIACSAA